MKVDTTITLEAIFTIVFTMISVAAAYFKLNNRVTMLENKESDVEESLDDLKNELRNENHTAVRSLEKLCVEKREDIIEKINKIEAELLRITERIEKDFGKKLKENMEDTNHKIGLLFNKYDGASTDIKELEKSVMAINTQMISVSELIRYLKDNKDIFIDYKVTKKISEITRDDLKELRKDLNSLKESIIRVRTGGKNESRWIKKQYIS